MRALSIRQPWAWLILHGGKDIENRGWYTSFRGEFLIHAAKGMTRDEWEGAFDTAYGVGGQALAYKIPEHGVIERGGIVGVAELYNVQPPLTWVEQMAGAKDPWHIPDQYGFRLRNVRPLPFLPCSGALNFWGNFEIRDGKAVRL